MSTKRIVYGMEVSPQVRAVLLTLKALNLDYEFVVLNRKNPHHKLPLLEDNGKYIWDSHAIIAYLVGMYAKDDSLYPKDLYERAVVDQRLHYETGVHFSNCLRQLVQPIYYEKLTKDEFAEQLQYVHEQYDIMEAFLSEVSYFAGSALTIADFSIVTLVVTLNIISPIDANKNPQLFAWYERMKQLPYYEAACGNGVKAEIALLGDKVALLQ